MSAIKKPTTFGFKDLTGKRFGGWLVISYAGRPKKTALWNCECKCGATRVVSGPNLKNGVTTSCGCSFMVHGRKTKTHRREFRSWQGAHYRCYDETDGRFSFYGARGIRMAECWHGPKGFDQFLKDMGPRPPGMSLERKDVNGDYTPDNCVWATQMDQMRNTRRNRKCTFRGATKCLMDWAIELGIPYDRLRNRLDRGWSIEKAFTTCKLR
jgi:hypothetical protein